MNFSNQTMSNQSALRLQVNDLTTMMMGKNNLRKLKFAANLKQAPDCAQTQSIYGIWHECKIFECTTRKRKLARI